jgi:hypothetical protein
MGSPLDVTIARIRAYALAMGWTRGALAKKAGLRSHNTLRKFDDPDWSPSVKTLRKLEALVPAEFIGHAEPKSGQAA